MIIEAIRQVKAINQHNHRLKCTWVRICQHRMEITCDLSDNSEIFQLRNDVMDKLQIESINHITREVTI